MFVKVRLRQEQCSDAERSNAESRGLHASDSEQRDTVQSDRKRERQRPAKSAVRCRGGSVAGQEPQARR